LGIKTSIVETSIGMLSAKNPTKRVVLEYFPRPLTGKNQKEIINKI
jgi:hypothetical protein